MSAYEAAEGMFPPGYIEWSGRGTPVSPNHLSAFVRILPYLEQAPLYASVNMELHFDAGDHPVVENHTARITQLAVFLCPSDGEPNHRNSYRLNSGRQQATRPFGPLDGPFAVGFLPTPAAITDGLSRTAFVSERLGGSFQASSRPDSIRDWKIPVDTPMAVLPPDDVYIEHCIDGPAQGWVFDEGRHWFYFGAGYTLYNHNGAPNDPRPTCGLDAYGLMPPRSLHSGVVNVLFGDGHVDAVTDSIQRQAWLAFGSVNGSD